MFCSKCGAQIADDTKFCPKCGSPTGKAQSSASSQDMSMTVPASNNTGKRFSNYRKWIILAIVIIAIVVVAIFVFARTGKPNLNNVLMTHSGESVLGSSYDTDQITRITFLDSLKDMPSDAWDASEFQDRSVMAWVEPDASEGGCYYLYIAGEGGVAANPDSSLLFLGYSQLRSIEFNDCFYTDLVLDMSYMFMSCEDLEEVDVGSWNTSNVEDMEKMFENCEALQTIDVRKWDTSNVTNMSYMFSDCSNLTTVNIGKWDTSNVKYMSSMFEWCEALQTVDVGKWDTSNVESMESMFKFCEALQTVDIENWNTSNVMSMRDMFYGDSKLREADVSQWDFSNILVSDDMFYGCDSLEQSS